MKASRIGATVVAGLLALGLAGCGSDDSDDTQQRWRRRGDE